MDVFYSARDWGYLGVGVAFIGTADRHWLYPAAGRTGFRITAHDSPDVALYERLRQHPWDAVVAWTGNHGGHYDAYQLRYLRSYVLPLLAQ
jgi:hypothetical protein